MSDAPVPDVLPAPLPRGRRKSDRAARLAGLRTWSFSIVALGFLLGGLNLCLINPGPGVAIFTAFAGAVVVIVGAVAGKSSIESLAGGGGLQGAWKSLTTSAKPEAPAPPPPPPVG